MLIDTHVHLSNDCYKDQLQNIIKNLENNNIEKVINVGFDFNSSKKGFKLSQFYENVYSALGIHPNNASEYSAEFEQFVDECASNKKVVAIGEIGLDYYRDKSQKELQKQVFIKQLKLAHKHKLPVILHVRDAFQDVLEILTEYKHLLSNSGVMHCYSGSLEFAQKILQLGLYLGFDGPITFKNSKIATNVVKHLPINKVLTETDCPYLTPHTYRGKQN